MAKLWCDVCGRLREDAIVKNEVFTDDGHRELEVHCAEGHFSRKKRWGKKKTRDFIVKGFYAGLRKSNAS